MTLEQLIDAGRVICPQCDNDAEFERYTGPDHGWGNVICGVCGWVRFVGAETNEEKEKREQRVSCSS